MIESFKTFEGLFLAKKRNLEFFDLNAKNFEKMMKLFEAGYCYPLSERDSEGRKIVMHKTRNWNTKLFSTMDVTRLMIYVVCVLLEEEETQICGISFVFDHEDITMSHIVPPLYLKDLIMLFINGGIARQKDTFVVNLPSFAAFFVEFLIGLMEEKLRKRDCLKDHIDPAMLPKEWWTQITRRNDARLSDFRKSEAKESSRIFKL
jgi:alpha-tocopherol transfer protein